MTTAGELVAEFWQRIQARDWVGLGALLAEDFSVEWPDTRVRIRGRDNFVEFNRTYPEGWTIDVLTVVSEGDTVVSEVRVPHAELGVFYVISILRVGGEQIVGGREYWLRENQEELTGERERLFEPM